MKQKELKRLTRAELLEMLLAQTQESERLRERLEVAQAQLADRELKLSRSGDLAQAAMAVNGVMEAAQAAAQQYLDNIRRMEREAAEIKENTERMEREAQERCEKLLADARKQADRIKRTAGSRKKKR